MEIRKINRNEIVLPLIFPFSLLSKKCILSKLEAPIFPFNITEHSLLKLISYWGAGLPFLKIWLWL